MAKQTVVHLGTNKLVATLCCGGLRTLNHWQQGSCLRMVKVSGQPNLQSGYLISGCPILGGGGGGREPARHQG